MTSVGNGSYEPCTSVQPIFILGILPRCGTHFLQELLCLHPDCGAPVRVHEDFFLREVNRLFAYVDSVVGHWSPTWGIDEAARRRLEAHLGTALITFLAEQTPAKRLVAKTPRVDNLEHFFRLLPDARLLILVRDGRAILESGITTFGWNREAAMHTLADAARVILTFDAKNRDRGYKYLIVRYEDLWQNQTEEMARILEFLGLDVGSYDIAAAAQLPVRGSSSIRKRGDGAMHWNPVEKAADFDPMSRWRHWTPAQHDRYNRVAGRYLARFGYEPIEPRGPRFFWSAWNAVQDAMWQLIRTLGPAYLAMKRFVERHHVASRPARRKNRT